MRASAGAQRSRSGPSPPVCPAFSLPRRAAPARRRGARERQRGWISERESRLRGVAVEHLDRVERVVVKIAPDERKLLQNVVRDRDDVAADLVSLEDVQQLSRTRPD